MSNYIFNGRKVMEDINTKIDTLNNIAKENNILKQSKKPPLGPTLNLYLKVNVKVEE